MKPGNPPAKAIDIFDDVATRPIGANAAAKLFKVLLE